MSHWDDSTVGNGLVFRCSLDFGQKWDVLAYTLESPSTEWLSTKSESDTDLIKQTRDKGKTVNPKMRKLYVSVPLEGGLIRPLEIKGKFEHFRLYLYNGYKKTKDEFFQTFIFYGATFKGAEINRFHRLLPIPLSKICIFEYNSMNEG